MTVPGAYLGTYDPPRRNVVLRGTSVSSGTCYVASVENSALSGITGMNARTDGRDSPGVSSSGITAAVAV